MTFYKSDIDKYIDKPRLRQIEKKKKENNIKEVLSFHSCYTFYSLRVTHWICFHG